MNLLKVAASTSVTATSLMVIVRRPWSVVVARAPASSGAFSKHPTAEAAAATGAPMARREALDVAGACERERTKWTFGAGDTSTAGEAAGAPELPFLTRTPWRTGTNPSSRILLWH
jgi:hypothetical protein